MDLHNEVTWEPEGKEPVTFYYDEPDLPDTMKLEALLSVPATQDNCIHPKIKLTAEQYRAMVDTCVKQVTGWSGMKDRGEEALCTEPLRRKLFSAVSRLDVVLKVFTALVPDMSTDEARKNGSGGGSVSASPTPEPSAERDSTESLDSSSDVPTSPV